MKLKELRKFLGNGKIKLQEHSRSRHLHYILSIENQPIGLPSILAVSQGDGEASLSNLKGIANSLGMTLHELEASAACRISRECILVMLCIEMLSFCSQRKQQLSNKSTGDAGIKAMATSIDKILNHIKIMHKGEWRKEELDALERSGCAFESISHDPTLSKTVNSLLEILR